MSNNPVYLFFYTSASVGPFLLRWGLATIFFYQGAQKAFGWFGGDGWDRTLQVWGNPEGANFPEVLIVGMVVTELLVSVSFLLGFLTRLSGFVVVILMSLALYLVSGGANFDALQFPLLLLISGLALLFMGAGSFSIDRALGKNLLPYVG